MSVSHQPIDFDRLLLKTNTQASTMARTSQIPVSSTLIEQSPLDLIHTLTSQFRSHFQQVKNDLSQKVQNSARQMAKFQQIKKQMKKQDDQWQKYKDVPNVPIQIYNFQEQKLRLSPKKNQKQLTHSRIVPSQSYIEQQSQYPTRKVKVPKKGTKQMDKFIFNKRFQKYLDQKYYRDPRVMVFKDGEEKGRYLREEGNILSAQFNQEPNDGKLKEFQNYVFSENEAPNFIHDQNKVLKFVKKYQYQYRKQAYKKIQLIARGDEENITKDGVVRYLFDHVVMMMLYSINPYKLVDEIANFITSTPNQMSFVQLSNFLLAPREPSTPQSYSQQSLIKAEQQSFKDGKVIEPVIPFTTWLGQDEVVEDIIKCFEYVDIFGKMKVNTQDLVLRLKKFATQKNLLNKQIYYITELGKPICIQRIIYEIQFEQPRRPQWTFNSFKELFKDYNKLITLPREQIIQNQMVEGNLDVTLLLNTSILTLLRQVYNNSPKYFTHYVDKLQYLDGVYGSLQFNKIKNCEVRRAPYLDINMQTVQEALARIYYEGDQFLEMDDIIQFFTNKGRPYIVNQRIKARNSEAQLLKIEYEDMARQNQDTKDSQDEDIQYSILRQQKKRKEFKTRQKKVNQIKQKMKNITVPVPFQFKQKVGETIRERKLKQMLDEKQQKIQQQMKPVVFAKQVPWFVKQNLYERLEEEKESLRRRRLEAHKSYLQTLMRPPPERLTQLPERGQNINDVPREQYQFVARTMPWYCEIELLQRIVKQKKIRKQRIRKEIEERQQEDGTPQGIKNMMERQKVLKQKWAIKDKQRQKKSKSQVKLKPFKRKPVPNFKKIFQQNGIELEVRYMKPQQPYIETWEQHKKKRVSFEKQEQAPPPPPAKSTQKFDALVQLRRKQRIEELVKKQKEREDQIDRKLAKQKMAPKVRSILKRMEKQHKQDLQKFGQRTDIKKQFQERQRWYAQTIYKAFQNVNERPLLIQTMNPPRVQPHQLQQVQIEPQRPKRKLRQKPIKKALRRTDDRNKNLEQRNLYNQQQFEHDEDEQQQEEEQEQDYDDDEYEQEKQQYLGQPMYHNIEYPESKDTSEKEKRQQLRKNQQRRLEEIRKEELKNQFERRIMNHQYSDEDGEGEDEEDYPQDQYTQEDGPLSDRHIGNRSF